MNFKLLQNSFWSLHLARLRYVKGIELQDNLFFVMFATLKGEQN